MKPELRRELLGYAGCLAFIVAVAYAIRLITSSLATLGIDWYWWLGFGMFFLPSVVALVERLRRPSHHEIARQLTRSEEFDLAKARYEYCCSRDAYLEAKQLRRIA